MDVVFYSRIEVVSFCLWVTEALLKLHSCRWHPCEWNTSFLSSDKKSVRVPRLKLSISGRNTEFGLVVFEIAVPPLVEAAKDVRFTQPARDWLQNKKLKQVLKGLTEVGVRSWLDHEGSEKSDARELLVDLKPDVFAGEGPCPSDPCTVGPCAEVKTL